MKSISKCIKIAVLILTLSSPGLLFAQTWSNWVEAPGSGISISFKLNTRDHICNGFGYSFYRFYNGNNQRITGGTIYFDYTDCDGERKTESYPLYMSPLETDQNNGLWFTGYQGQRIDNIHVENLRLAAQ